MKEDAHTDREVAVAHRLHQADMLALKKDDPTKGHVHQEQRHAEEDRRQGPTHASEHVEPVVEKSVRILVPAPVGRPTAIRGQNLVEPADHVRLRCAAGQGERDRGKRPVEVEDRRQGVLAHPDDPEAAIVGHEVAGAGGVDEFG